ncbi:MAG: (Fe-S)-binding protein [Candidatus Nanoarchaeia archaeon]|nr:(Fe-S)-binding protein [Candidatus Haiyanarchaeum thermophilum]MCW1303308.1 (Fe-S)-binding protein [Candidatus Haiyanarchaeum thermophilum]MCW1303960.1 (Fe-S)-binding protein [Candidatus Haiyanarchaeum thermophilum]MCW1306467.1 (Fe-S)-binding protein [Candidatus Haiyanarchaeum thermophilum]MCW1307235.1 (Fe-S)-binding protein [Candidatus Haiyanarchaeum thermophilum]
MIFHKFFGRNTLFYPGCLLKFLLPELRDKYSQILEKIGLDFIELEKIELCCGSPILSAGYPAEFKKVATKNLELFNKYGVEKIITACPACYRTLKFEYPLVASSNIQVEHISQTILRAMEEGKLKYKSRGGVVTYHDPCHLGRYSGIYEEPRQILRKLGYKVVEMKLNREYSFCCGGGGGVKANYPKLALEIAKDRVLQAMEVGAELLVTTCPMCYISLKGASEELNNKIKVVELSEIL